MAKRELRQRLDELFSSSEDTQPAIPLPVTTPPGALSPPASTGDAPPEPDRLFRSIFDALPDFIAVLDRQTKRFLHANRAMLERYGYTLEELRSLTLHRLHPPEEMETLDQNTVDSDEKAPHLYTHITRRGERMTVEIRTEAFDYGGRPAWLSAMRDVTDRHQMEMELVRRNQDLETIIQVSHSLHDLDAATDVFELVFTVIGQVLDNRNLCLALYDESMNYITFPIYTVDGERRSVAGHPFGDGLAEYVIQTRTVLLPDDVGAELERLGVAHIGRAALSLLAVPLVAGTRVIGVMTLQDYEREHVYQVKHAEVLAAMAGPMAVALENARLYASVERRAVQLETAAAVSRAASSILNLDELLPATAELIRSQFDLYYVGLFLVDAAREYAVLRAGTGDAGRTMLERGHRLAVNGQSMIGWCVANRKARIALDVGVEAVRFDNPWLPETRSELALPLLVHGEVIGAMSVQSAKETAFGDVDIAALQSMADQVANAIGNARLFEQAQKRVAELATINSISQALGSQLELGALLEAIVDKIRRFFGVSKSYVALYDSRSDTIEIPLIAEGDRRLSIEPHPLSAGFTSYIIHTRRSLLINRDIIQRAEELGARAMGKPAKSYLGVPMVVRADVLGVIAVQDTEREEAFGEVEERMLMTIAPSVGIAIENARLFERTQAALAETQRLAQREHVANRIAAKIRAAVSVEEVLRVASDELWQATGASRAVAQIGKPVLTGRSDDLKSRGWRAGDDG